MLLPIAEDPLQARPGAAVPRGRWSGLRRLASRLGPGVAGLAGHAAAATAARAQQNETEAAPEVDAAGRARRLEARERKVATGIQELDRWLADLVRRGLDSARGEGYQFWDAMGARLVDAQAAGLGRSVRALGSAASSGEDWPHLLLERLARLHLLAEAYRRGDELPEPLRLDVRAQVGWTTKEDDLDPADSVVDRWLVVGRRVDDSGQVITARTFLLGEQSGRFALHLAFGVDMAPPTALASPGQAFRATLTFYPSAAPLRAAVRPVIEPAGEVEGIPAPASIGAVIDAQRSAWPPTRSWSSGRWRSGRWFRCCVMAACPSGTPTAPRWTSHLRAWPGRCSPPPVAIP